MTTYTIERTSDYYRTKKPVEHAYQDGVDEYGYPIWKIDICCIEAIDNLVNNAGAPIIISSDKHIEIYDDYRE